MYAFGGRLGPRGALELPFLDPDGVAVACGIVDSLVKVSTVGLAVAKVDWYELIGYTSLAGEGL